ncbi:MAG: hypothetical protein COV73_00455 [Candidatus Omnitrophica bacterium CG11_big_fil_rev_8_21_14_0_20_43_6]|nr:MAG: hypothetical protein COV73_00455 [Candidatus Omnitrophica bacterium CG11_big_fil_rev_8_21_14_0_20_43_6]
MEEWAFFDILREIVFWSSPVVFLMGLVLLMYGNYRNIELLMGREFGLRKRILPKLEQNIYSFHGWCLKKHTLIGLICILYALVVFIVLRRCDSLNEVIGEV